MVLLTSVSWYAHLFALVWALNSSTPTVSSSKASGCKRRLYIVRFHEAEQHSEFLENCTIGKFARALEDGIAASPCSVASPEESDVVVMPTYFAASFAFWPVYLPANRTVNHHRSGYDCEDERTMTALQKLHAERRFDGKTFFFVDLSEKGYILPVKQVYSNNNYIWGTLVSLEPQYRKGIDISLPPGPHPRCSSEQALRALDEPLAAKKYFATFKGKFRGMNPLRRDVETLHHNGRDIIIADAWNEAYDYDELLFSSIFSLLIVGDLGTFTARFPEAVCSGGIPVWVGWSEHVVSPFDALIPARTYSIRVSLQELPELVTRLRAIDAERLVDLRENAKQACKIHFQTIEAQIASIASFLSGHSSQGDWVRHRLQSEQPYMGPSSNVGVQRCPDGYLYALSFEEVEQLWPEFRECHVSSYAMEMQRGLRMDPCAVEAFEKAEFIIFPGYAAVEYDSVSVDGGIRWRAGRLCKQNTTFQVYRQLQRLKVLRKKQLVALDSSDVWWSRGHLGHLYDRHSLVFAEWNPTPGWHRHSIDISLPRRPHRPISGVSSSPFLEKRDKKQYFLSFIGAVNEHPLQEQIAKVYHNGQDVVIVDTSSPDYDEESLLTSSVFHLILPRKGNTLSARFNDAVCSGGVPVLIGDGLVPPFESCTPFRCYGVQVEEFRIHSLLKILQGIGLARYQELREKSRKACLSHFQAIDMHAATLAKILTAKPLCNMYGPCHQTSRTYNLEATSYVQAGSEMYAVMNGVIFRLCGQTRLELIALNFTKNLDAKLKGLLDKGNRLAWAEVEKAEAEMTTAATNELKHFKEYRIEERILSCAMSGYTVNVKVTDFFSEVTTKFLALKKTLAEGKKNGIKRYSWMLVNGNATIAPDAPECIVPRAFTKDWANGRELFEETLQGEHVQSFQDMDIYWTNHQDELLQADPSMMLDKQLFDWWYAGGGAKLALQSWVVEQMASPERHKELSKVIEDIVNLQMQPLFNKMSTADRGSFIGVIESLSKFDKGILSQKDWRSATGFKHRVLQSLQYCVKSETSAAASADAVTKIGMEAIEMKVAALVEDSKAAEVKDIKEMTKYRFFLKKDSEEKLKKLAVDNEDKILQDGAGEAAKKSKADISKMYVKQATQAANSNAKGASSSSTSADKLDDDHKALVKNWFKMG